METLLKEIGLALCDIRRQKPLIHEITNYVTPLTVRISLWR